MVVLCLAYMVVPGVGRVGIVVLVGNAAYFNSLVLCSPSGNIDCGGPNLDGIVLGVSFVFFWGCSFHVRCSM